MKRKILLIEDDALVAKSLVRLLEAESYCVITATGAEEGLSLAASQDPDLIISDIRMPGKNGVETIKEIQSSLIDVGRKDLPIIFVTGYAEYGDRLHANFLGEVLYKPIDNNKLLATIRDYL